MANWAFPRNDADEDEGLANAGIEFFRDSPYSGIARECGQNSLDAAKSDPDTGNLLQVVLEFRRNSIPTRQIPSVTELTQTMSACLKRAKDRAEEKETEFFSRACALLSEPSVDALQISDSGTKGLRGPSKQGTPFHALVKASGVSEKENKSAGGSFGIGKNAAYAVSALRTVFYSTLYADDAGEQHFLCQGKAILASHKGLDGQAYRAAGYWGAPGFQPLASPETLPDWLTRSTQGTTVSSLGFVGGGDWQHQVAESLIRNFFAAIQRGAISFRIDEWYDVNSSTLEGLFNDPQVAQASDAHGYADDLRFSASLHACLTSDEAFVVEESFEDLGRVRLRLLVKDGLPKRVALLRNGMYITDSLQHFGDKLSRFALQKDFVAVLEPVDKDTGQVIRSLENPRHDELSPERIENPAQQRRIKSAFKRLIAWVREQIRSQTMTAAENEILLDELNQFFASPNELRAMPDADSVDNDPEKLKIQPLEARRIKMGGRNGTGTDGGFGGSKKSKTKGGQTSGGGTGRGHGGSGTRGGRTVPLEDFRNRFVDGRRELRRIYFTTGATGLATVRVFAPGVSSPEELKLKSLAGSDLAGKTPTIEIVDGERRVLDLGFYFDYAGPLEVVLELVEKSNEA